MERLIAANFNTQDKFARQVRVIELASSGMSEWVSHFKLLIKLKGISSILILAWEAAS